MSNPFNQGNAGDQGGPNGPGGGGDKPQQPGHFSARVPEGVGRGVYCTGQIIHDSPKEFVIDFLQGLNRPFQVVARVVMTPATMGEFISTFELNLNNYVNQFGQPTAPPPPPSDRRPTIEEIYEHYKISDEMLSGTYSNTVLIGHAPTEFVFDFITGFYPTPSVSSRVILPAGQAPRFLGTLKGALQQYAIRHAKTSEKTAEKPTEPPTQQP